MLISLVSEEMKKNTIELQSKKRKFGELTTYRELSYDEVKNDSFCDIVLNHLKTVGAHGQKSPRKMPSIPISDIQAIEFIKSSSSERTSIGICENFLHTKEDGTKIIGRVIAVNEDEKLECTLMLFKWTEGLKNFFTIEKDRDVISDLKTGQWEHRNLLMRGMTSAVVSFSKRESMWQVINKYYESKGQTNDKPPSPQRDNRINVAFTYKNQGCSYTIPVNLSEFATKSNFISEHSTKTKGDIAIDLTGKIIHVDFIFPVIKSIQDGKMPLVTSDLPTICGFYEVAQYLKIPSICIACEHQFYKMLSSREVIAYYTTVSQYPCFSTLRNMCELFIAYQMVEGNSIDNAIAHIKDLDKTINPSLIDCIRNKDLNYKGPHKFPVHPELKKVLDSEL
jgi:hypothetical protein